MKTKDIGTVGAGSGAGVRPKSQRQICREAGISKHREKLFVRVGNIPEDEFERLIEFDTPPTMTELGRLGTKRRRDGYVPPQPDRCPHCGQPIPKKTIA